jgi:hypothetical protein
MTDDDSDEGAYDPAEPTPPEQAPPRRSTAPQSPYTARQIAFGAVVLLVGLAVTFGLGVALA